MAVSKMAFKIVKSAVQIRLERGETLDDILNSYPKLSQAQANEILEEFKNVDKGVICSVKALNTGADIPGLSVEIVANVDSSKITKVQKTGRCIRFEDNKFAEIFTLLIAGTQEINWFRNSSTTDYTVITEKQLDDVLAGKQVEGTKFSSFFDKNKRY